MRFPVSRCYTASILVLFLIYKRIIFAAQCFFLSQSVVFIDRFDSNTFKLVLGYLDTQALLQLNIFHFFSLFFQCVIFSITQLYFGMVLHAFHLLDNNICFKQNKSLKVDLYMASLSMISVNILAIQFYLSPKKVFTAEQIWFH